MYCEKERSISMRIFRVKFVPVLLLCAILLCPCLLGCGEYKRSDHYLEGIVIEEGGTVHARQQATLQQSSGAMFGNESIKISEPTYFIKVKTEPDGDIVTLQIIGSYSKDALASAIEAGTEISVVRSNVLLRGSVGYVYSRNLSVW